MSASCLPEDWFERLELGILEFNQGKYFDCHETLERCWQEQGPVELAEADPHRQWVQGMIQIAVAYHHLERGNVKGALKLLNRGYGRIKKFPLVSYPLDLVDFETIVQSTIELLEGLPEPFSLQNTVQFPKVAYK